MYLNDIFNNTISFEDNIQWGCKDSFNSTGLKNYCNAQSWKYKMIFNLFNNITYVAKFGNPDRLKILDWVSVDPFDLNSYSSTWDDVHLRCTIPAVFNIDIVYGTFGMVNNTQNSIIKIKKRLDYMYFFLKSAIGMLKMIRMF